MELKRFTARDNLSLYNLLIVPYGIETFHLNVNRHRLMFF